MEQGKLKVVQGDVTNPWITNKNEVVIIPHCCNDLGIMGKGVALALKEKWPLVEDVYKMQSLTLGFVSFAHVQEMNNEDQIVVVNMIGQHGTVHQDNPKPVKYWALSEAMLRVRFFCEDNYGQNDAKPVIHCPKFGSDLAKGNWDFILELIREIWLENGIDVVVYEYVPPK